jgi:hypothetical protein
VIIETIAEKLALRMLAESGDAVISNAHAAAAAARAAGKLEAATAFNGDRRGRRAPMPRPRSTRVSLNRGQADPSRDTHFVSKSHKTGTIR